MIEIEEKPFTIGRITLNYAEVPSDEPPLVLLHGGSGRWQTFEAILPDLAANFHLYAPDFRGHGKSEWIPGSYRLQDYANDTIAFLRHHFERPVFIFGHSLGGIIALMVAAQYPDGVRAAAVGDAPLTSQTWHAELQSSRERLIAWRALAGGQKPFPEVIEILKDAPLQLPDQDKSVPMREVVEEESPVFGWLAANLYHNDPDMMSALIDRFETTAAGYEMETLLPVIECPVLLLQGDPAVGGLMGDDEAAEARSLLAHPHHVKLEGLSHALYNEQKEPVLEALERFFDAC